MGAARSGSDARRSIAPGYLSAIRLPGNRLPSAARCRQICLRWPAFTGEWRRSAEITEFLRLERLSGWDADHCFFRIAECAQFAAEHTAGIDVDRIVHETAFGNRGMAVDDERFSFIMLCPVPPYRTSVRQRLAGDVPVQDKRAQSAAVFSADQVFAHSGM